MIINTSLGIICKKFIFVETISFNNKIYYAKITPFATITFNVKL
jgi:hypothetical protein